MVFIQNKTHYQELLKDGKEAVYFDDVEDLAEKIIFYKHNKEKALNIAYNGHKKMHNDFNEKIITNYMLDCLKFNDASKLVGKYNWPIHFYN